MLDYKKVFGENVRKYRLERGLSQEQLAEKVGLGSKSISPIENGYSFIAIEKLSKFCEALQVPAFSLFVCNSEQEKDLLLKTEIFNKLKDCKHSDLLHLSDILNVIVKH